MNKVRRPANRNLVDNKSPLVQFYPHKRALCFHWAVSEVEHVGMMSRLSQFLSGVKGDVKWFIIYCAKLCQGEKRRWIASCVAR